jgi:hypothetical protein
VTSAGTGRWKAPPPAAHSPPSGWIGCLQLQSSGKAFYVTQTFTGGPTYRVFVHIFFTTEK